MKLDQVSIFLDNGLSAHVFRSAHGCALFLGDNAQPLYRGKIILHAPLDMTEKIECIAGLINAVMAGHDLSGLIDAIRIYESVA